MEKQKETIVDKVKNGIKNAMTEIDELRVQLALGKAEAKELFEEHKKKFRLKIQEIETELQTLKKDETLSAILNALESIRLQLALGKAETKEMFEENYKHLNKALHDLEYELSKNSKMTEIYSRLHLEIEKFKIKMEFLALHFKLKKLKGEYNLELKKKEIEEKFDKLKSQLKTKQKEGEEKWENFKEEITEAYDHFKNAFKFQ